MKRLVCVLLALALSLGLGAPALAGGEDGGPALPRLDVYLGECEAYEEGVADNEAYGMDDFLWATATVPLEQIDRVLGYMALLEDGAFDLELAYCVKSMEGGADEDVELDHCSELAYDPEAVGYAAAFDYVGEGDVSPIPGAMAPVGGGSAVGVSVQTYEDTGTADINLFCGEGFRFTDQWQDGDAGQDRDGTLPDSDGFFDGAVSDAGQDRDGTLPDPYSFLNGAVSYKCEESKKDVAMYTFVLEELTLAPAEAYVELLSDPRYGLVLSDEKQGVTYGGDDYRWWKFDYTGDKDIGGITFYGDTEPSCSLYVYCSAILNTTFNVRCVSGGFTFVDYGDRYPEKATDAFDDPASRGRLTGVLGTVHPSGN